MVEVIMAVNANVFSGAMDEYTNSKTKLHKRKTVENKNFRLFGDRVKCASLKLLIIMNKDNPLAMITFVIRIDKG